MAPQQCILIALMTLAQIFIITYKQSTTPPLPLKARSRWPTLQTLTSLHSLILLAHTITLMAVVNILLFL
jgi:hypothetical protein